MTSMERRRPLDHTLRQYGYGDSTSELESRIINIISYGNKSVVDRFIEAYGERYGKTIASRILSQKYKTSQTQQRFADLNGDIDFLSRDVIVRFAIGVDFSDRIRRLLVNPVSRGSFFSEPKVEFSDRSMATLLAKAEIADLAKLHSNFDHVYQAKATGKTFYPNYKIHLPLID